MNFTLALLNKTLNPKLKLLLGLLITMQLNSSIAKEFNTDELTALSKVWGFLKYHHPVVAIGKVDWDKEFIKMTSTKNTADFNSTMINWIFSMGKLKTNKSQESEISNENYSLAWINTEQVFNDSLRAVLKCVYHSRNRNSSYYVKSFFVNGTVMFKHENEYLNMDYSNFEMRMLAVSRYWNAINYFYPYVKLIHPNWSAVLPQAIERMRSVSNRDNYVKTLRWMVKATEDGHNNLSVFYSFKEDSLRWPEFSFRVFDHRIIVDGYYSNDAKLKLILQVGDEIIKVGQQTSSEHIKDWSSYINASNSAGLNNYISNFVLADYDSLVHINVRRADSVFNLTLSRYPLAYFYKIQSSIQSVKDTVISNIPYLNLEYVSKSEIDAFIKKYFESKVMIVDLRNYPKDDPKVVFAKYMLSERKKFADITLIDVSNPGSYRRMKMDSSLLDYSWIGSRSKKTFKGKVILLVDANTISHAEYTAMAMQVMPQVVVIGSQTGGANGNVTSLILPGGLKTYFSGLGVSYPDGTQSQRLGIKINIKVKEASSSNLSADDLILRRAIEYASTIIN